jgi:hypothetical protein
MTGSLALQCNYVCTAAEHLLVCKVPSQIHPSTRSDCKHQCKCIANVCKTTVCTAAEYNPLTWYALPGHIFIPVRGVAVIINDAGGQARGSMTLFGQGTGHHVQNARTAPSDPRDVPQHQSPRSEPLPRGWQTTMGW